MSSSDDGSNIGLDIKPPQAERRREKPRDSDKHRYDKYGGSKSKKSHHRSRDDEYSSKRRHHHAYSDNYSREQRHRVREDVSSHRDRSSHHYEGGGSGYSSGSGSKSKRKYEDHHTNGSSKGDRRGRDYRTEELEKQKERRKYAEQEEERMFKEIERRRRQEKRHHTTTDSKSRDPSPSPPPKEAEDSDFELEKDTSNIFEVKEIEASPVELEPLREDSHSDISDEEVNSKGNDDEEDDESSSSSSSSSSDSVSAVSSDSSSSEEEGEVEHTSTSSSNKKSRKRNGVTTNDKESSNIDNDEVNGESSSDPIPSKKRRKESPESQLAVMEEKKATTSPFRGKGDKSSSNMEVDNAGIAEVAVVDEIKKEDLLPPYFPALQGCRRVEEYSLLNRIEEGTYGIVFRASDKRTNEIVALKRLKMEKEKDGFPITSLREINTLLKAQHENIVTVREIVVGSNTDKIFIVMDYVEHDLKSLMETLKKKNQMFILGEVKCLMIQLLRAVAHLHDNWILHRDLKTSNLLLSHKGILKVGDFGLAREYGSPLKAYTSIVVTLWYRAPELLLGVKEYSTQIDVWSVGCIFGELLKMAPMFPGKSEANELNLIFSTLGTPNERIWPGYSSLPLLQKMTFTDYPMNRLKSRFEMLSEAGIDLLNKLLTYSPQKRITAEEALKHRFFEETPLPIDPSVFPTWPAKSEMGHKKAAASPKPPSGGRQFKDLNADDNSGFFIETADRRAPIGPGFSLKF